MSHKNRRKFLQQIAAITATAAVNPVHGAIAANKRVAQVNAETLPSKYTLNILQTTDVHCQLYPHDELFWENEQTVFRKTGGYAHVATLFKKEKKANPHTFILDTGDMFQGSELSVKTTGQAITPILNALGYDLYLPGNWEVVYYKKAMQQLLGSLYAPKICANMYHDIGNGTKGELIFQPYHIWSANGIKIGFIGYTDPLVPIRQSPNYSKGIIYTKPEENIAYYIDVLKNQEQCQSIIVIAHLGLSQQIALANDKVCEGVDFILGGDTHERVRIPIQCTYAKVVEPGAFGSFVGKLQFHIENDKIVNTSYELIEVDPKKYKADSHITKLINNIQQPYTTSIEKVIGYSTLPLYRNFVLENTIDTLLLNAIKNQVADVDIVLSNGFRFCPPRATYNENGLIPITEGYLYDMLPIDSNIRKGEVSGKQIVEWMEKELNNVFAANASERFGGWVVKFNGMKMKFYAYGEKGKRIDSITINGSPLDPAKNYRICACERDGDPEDMLCRIKGVKNAKNISLSLHTAIKNYLITHNPVTPALTMSAIALDAPATLLSQVSGVKYKFT
jgi:S-sulfosulfanyl-L-cysteine sulfohydrolase